MVTTRHHETNCLPFGVTKFKIQRYFSLPYLTNVYNYSLKVTTKNKSKSYKYILNVSVSVRTHLL